MIASLWLFGKRIFQNLLITSGVLGLLWGLSPIALAGYNTNDQKPPSSNTNAGGTRGGNCDDPNGTPFMILAPFSHIGKTASTRPTFAWFVPTMSQSHWIEFRLYEYDENNRFHDFGEPILRRSSSGVMSLSLPENQPQLTVGKTYLWQVSLICNDDNDNSYDQSKAYDHSKDILVSAEMEVVTMPSNLTTSEMATIDNVERVERYLNAGLWYDALSSAGLNNADSQLGTAGIILLNELLTFEEDELQRISQLPPDSTNLKQSEVQQQFINSLRSIITNFQSK